MDDGVKDEQDAPDNRRFVQWYEEFFDATRIMRQRAEESHDFYHNIQWTEKQRNTLHSRGQPANTYNEVKPQIDFLIGMEKQQRTDPRAYPRTPFHEQDAEAATDSMRFIADREDYDTVRSGIWFDLLSVGWGGAELVPVQKAESIDLELEQNDWDRMWWDPHSSKPDFSDARYKGLVRWVDLQDALFEYRQVKDIEEKLAGAKKSLDGDLMDTHEDRPKDHGWFDSKRKRIKLCIVYYQERGAWRFAEFTGGDNGLLSHGESPILDDDGVPDDPYVWASSYVSRDNQRFGLIDEMKDRQREVNKRHSKLMHLLNTERSYAKKNAVASAKGMKEQLAKPDGHIVLNENAKWGEDAGIIGTEQEVLGHFQLLQEAKESIRRLGASQALTGKEEKDLSGKAMQVQQQGSLIEIGALLDRLRGVDKRLFRKMWMGVRQFWDAPKWVRVTDDERNVRFVGLNVPPEAVAGVEIPENITLAQRPIAEMDVDIIIEDAPDVVTLAGEQFDQLISLAQVGIVLPPEVYVQAAPNLRNKDLILEIVQSGQAPDPEREAQADKTSAEAEDRRASALLKNVQAAEKVAEASTPGVNTIQ